MGYGYDAGVVKWLGLREETLGFSHEQPDSSP
jgi:hypothetical protein